MSGDRRKLNLREDWPVMPLFILFFIGLAVSVYDFIVLQGLHIQLNPTRAREGARVKIRRENNFKEVL
jgi:hypothetical protein